MAMKKVSKGSGANKDAERFKFETKGDVLEGYLVDKDSFTFNDKDIKRYTIQTDDGVVSTLGSFKLDELMTDVPAGVRVRITYDGKERLKGGKTLKQFTVEYDEADRVSA